jgi:hypothetical protein
VVRAQEYGDSLAEGERLRVEVARLEVVVARLSSDAKQIPQHLQAQAQAQASMPMSIPSETDHQSETLKREVSRLEAEVDQLKAELGHQEKRTQTLLHEQQQGYDKLLDESEALLMEQQQQQQQQPAQPADMHVPTEPGRIREEASNSTRKNDNAISSRELGQRHDSIVGEASTTNREHKHSMAVEALLEESIAAVRTLETALDKSEARVAAAQAKVTSLEKTVESLSLSSQQSSSSSPDFAAKLKEAETELDALRRRVNELELSETSAQQEPVQAQLAQHEANASAAEEQEQKKKKETGDMSSPLSLPDALERLRAQNAQLESKEQALEKANKQGKDDLRALVALRKELEQHQKQHVLALEQQHKEKAALEREVEAKNAQLVSARRATDRAVDGLAKVEQRAIQSEQAAAAAQVAAAEHLAAAAAEAARLAAEAEAKAAEDAEVAEREAVGGKIRSKWPSLAKLTAYKAAAEMAQERERVLAAEQLKTRLSTMEAELQTVKQKADAQTVLFDAHRAESAAQLEEVCFISFFRHFWSFCFHPFTKRTHTNQKQYNTPLSLPQTQKLCDAATAAAKKDSTTAASLSEQLLALEAALDAQKRACGDAVSDRTASEAGKQAVEARLAEAQLSLTTELEKARTLVTQTEELRRNAAVAKRELASLQTEKGKMAASLTEVCLHPFVSIFLRFFLSTFLLFYVSWQGYHFLCISPPFTLSPLTLHH